MLLLYTATAWPLDFIMSAPAFGHVDTAVQIIIINMPLSVSLDLVFNSRSIGLASLRGRLIEYQLRLG